MGPPPSALACGCPGVVRVVLGVRAFGEHAPPAFVPRVECFAPSGGGFGIVDAGERVGEFLELPAGLQSGSGGQVGPGVALHVHQTSLDPRVRPDLRARLENAFHAVAYEHVGRGQLREQRLVGGCVLPCAPLPGEHLAVLAVDRRQQAPAVHVGAVGHDRAVHHAIRFDARLEPPAPVHAFAEVARALRAFALRRGLEQPVQELRQLGAAPFGVVPGAGGQPASIALPTLPAHAVVSVLAHRRLADRAFLRLLRTCPHDTHCTRNHASRWTPPSATGRHAYCHKGKPESKSITLVPIMPCFLSFCS